MDNQENDTQEVLMMRFQTFIPDNEYGIEEGYYIGNAIVKLLRDYKDRPEVIEFIAVRTRSLEFNFSITLRASPVITLPIT